MKKNFAFIRKGFLCGAIILFFSITAMAQSPNYLWAKNSTGACTSAGNAGITVATDPKGNVLVVGYFQNFTLSFGSTNLTNQGGGDIYLVKYDAAGNLLWAKSAGGVSNDYASGLTTDTSGNIIITGYFNSPTIVFGAFTLTNADYINGNSSRGDVFIVKYDSSGNVLWARRAGAPSDDTGVSACTDASGNILITGYFQSPAITFGSITLTSADNQGYMNNMFVAKLDASGNTLWAKSAGGSSMGNSVTTDANGSVIVVGSFYDTDITFETTTLNNSDYTGPASTCFL